MFSENKVVTEVHFDDKINFIEINSVNNSLDIHENSINFLFSGCTNLVYVSEIPSSVISMNSTFRNCTSLVNAPGIPNSVVSMDTTFENCTNLVKAPIIPNSVTEMPAIFSGCTNLTGTVRINASNVVLLVYIFENTTKPITVEVPAGSVTYTKISELDNLGMPSNVTLTTFNAS